MIKFVVLVALFAAVVYAIAWSIERRRALGGAEGAGGAVTGGRLGRRGAQPPVKQVAPDDDEDFLRWLDRKRRKDAREGAEESDAAAGAGAADAPDPTQSEDVEGAGGVKDAGEPPADHDPLEPPDGHDAPESQDSGDGRDGQRPGGD